MSGSSEPGPASLNRRKLLVVGGFAATNALLLGKAGRSSRSTSDSAPGTVVGPETVATRTQEPPAVAEADPTPQPRHIHDLVILGGRVMDPESGFDDVAHVGIDGGTITSISRQKLEGRETIEADGLVVAPGFIDILSYDPNPYGIWYKVGDGVTTNLGMHGIDSTAEAFFERWDTDAQRPPTHFGGAFDNPFFRNDRFKLTPADAASPQQVAEIANLAEAQLKGGWIGIDVEPEYTPEITYDEIRALGKVASKTGVPMFFHARYSDPEPPGTNAEAVAEVLRTARDTGASVHIEHITSTGGTFTMAKTLKTLDKARDDGVDVTACIYPYDFWATTLGSPRFGPGWQERFRIDYDDLEIAGTGERLTKTSFAKYQEQNKLAAAHGAIPEREIEMALRAPYVMIGSDAILEEGDNNHPRCSGAFSRTLGVYARDRKVISLMQALEKMTILPAKRLEGRVPALRHKGRMQMGADADITIFDPERIRDRSTVKDPAQMSEGVEWVLVLGQVVKDATGPRDDVRPGRPIKTDLA